MNTKILVDFPSRNPGKFHLDWRRKNFRQQRNEVAKLQYMAFTAEEVSVSKTLAQITISMVGWQMFQTSKGLTGWFYSKWACFLGSACVFPQDKTSKRVLFATTIFALSVFRSFQGTSCMAAVEHFASELCVQVLHDTSTKWAPDPRSEMGWNKPYK